MPFTDVSSKEITRLLLKALLEKLPATRSNKGLFISYKDQHAIISDISSVLTPLCFQYYKRSSYNKFSWLPLTEEVFRKLFELVLFKRFSVLPRAGMNGSRIIDKLSALDSFVEATLNDMDKYGFFGNLAPETLLAVTQIISIFGEDFTNASYKLRWRWSR